jgi:hypothetical protein
VPVRWLGSPRPADAVRTRGTFRPRLLSLVRSNEASAVVDTTKEALKLYALEDDAHARHAKAMKELCALRGVGPATASLVLSVAFPKEIPFFSDEAYAWLMGWKDMKSGNLKYSQKEYDDMVGRTQQLIARLQDQGGTVTASDVEKVGWTIMKLQDETIRDRVSEANSSGKVLSLLQAAAMRSSSCCVGKRKVSDEPSDDAQTAQEQTGDDTGDKPSSGPNLRDDGQPGALTDQVGSKRVRTRRETRETSVEKRPRHT